MIKKDVVKQLADKSICYGISQKQIGEIVTELFNVVTESLLNHEDVVIRGFGHFRVDYRQPRIINHPTKKEQIMSHPKYVVLFQPALNVKRALRVTEPESTDKEV